MAMSKPSIKAVTIKKLVRFGLLFLLAMLGLIAINFHTLIGEAIRDKGETLARAVESALTSHMLAGTYKDKENIIHSASLLPGIQNLRIIRSDAINQQFGLRQDQTQDAATLRAFDTKAPVYTMPQLLSAQTSLRVSYPYVATATEPVNCLACHQVEAGEVLAVLDFQIDMRSYLRTSTHYLYILFFSFTVILTLTALFITRTLDHNIMSPLKWLVEETQTSYKKHIAIDTDRYNSLELDYVATKINQFNQVVLAQNDELTTLNQEIEATQREIILAMGYIGEARSKETANHVRRVADLSFLLARHLGLDAKQCDWIKEAAPMHDIGKVGIPDSILHKPDKLTDEEYALMKQHSLWGYNVFCSSERPMLKAASIIAQQHHERWDGKGYPQGLKGEDIHIMGRIVAVADVFDALSCRRCYKDAWPMEKVRDYFRDAAGSQFDPALVQLLLDHFDEAQAIISKYSD